MNHSTTFMDKQIMDLSNSQSSGNPDFIDFMNRPSEKKDDIVPSYDFMPIRPAGRSSSPPPPATRSSIFDSGDEDPPLRTCNSLDSITDASAIRNYSSADADEPAKFTLGKNHKPVNAPSDVSLLAEIDRTIKQHADNLMHAMEGVSARLTQLETRTHNLENLVDDLKLSVENTHEIADGKMRQLENTLREVQAGVQVIRDKQEIAQAHLHYLPKVEQVENQNTPHTGPTQPVARPHQQFNISPTPPPPILPPPNVPPQNYQPQVQIPNQYPQNQGPPIPQLESYFPEQGQTPENPTHQYQLPPPQQQQHPPTTNQYPPPHQTPYSQPTPPPQSHPSFPAAKSSPQPPSSHYPEEMAYSPSQIYPPGTHQPPHQQFYGPPPSVYDAPSSRPGPGYSGPFGPPSRDVDNTYPYSSSGSSYGSGSPRKQHVSSPVMGQSGGNSYLQLPTARILPQALPTASGVGAGSGSGSGNKVPIDDVVDKVTNMGFPRDQVRATVRILTENGEAVDLNIVLDKLMNGDDQAPRGGWFGR